MSLNDSTKILLVEGVPGTGKSTLIGSMIRRYVGGNKRIRSLLHLTQAHTYHPLSPDESERSPTPAQNIAHLERILDLLHWMAAVVSDEQRKIFLCAIDTLHITHCFRPGVLSWADVEDFDRRIAALGCRLLFLRATEKTIWERTIRDRRDNEFITYYGKRYGDSLESIHQYYVQEQEKMLATLERSSLEKLILDAEDSISDISREAFDYWMK